MIMTTVNPCLSKNLRPVKYFSNKERGEGLDSTVCPSKESGHLMEDYSVDAQCFGKISSGY